MFLSSICEFIFNRSCERSQEGVLTSSPSLRQHRGCYWCGKHSLQPLVTEELLRTPHLRTISGKYLVPAAVIQSSPIWLGELG